MSVSLTKTFPFPLKEMGNISTLTPLILLIEETAPQTYLKLWP